MIADSLGSLGCNIYRMLVVDLLHEFELGVFKTVFRHLLRLLYAIDPSKVPILNHRYAVVISSNNYTIKTLVKISPDTTIWKGFNSLIPPKCCRSSSVRSSTLRGHSPGMIPFVIWCATHINRSIPSVQFLPSKICFLLNMTM